MRQWMLPVMTLLVGAGIAVGATLGVTRPWQSEEATPVSTPAPSQEESEKIACLQGGGNWIHTNAAIYCGSGTCWACVHPVPRVPSSLGNLND